MIQTLLLRVLDHVSSVAVSAHPGGVTLLRIAFPSLRRSTVLLLTSAILFLASPPPLRSQASATNEVSGVVTDQTGTAMQSATVVFTSGSLSATQTTNSAGKFAFSQ